MNGLGVLFDNNGSAYSIENVELYVGEMKDRLLVDTYVSTIYFHELTIVMEDLVNKGFAKGKKNENYKPKITLNAISAMKNEIIERFDEEYHDYVISKIDLSFTKKKPKEI